MDMKHGASSRKDGSRHSVTIHCNTPCVMYTLSSHPIIFVAVIARPSRVTPSFRPVPIGSRPG